MSHKKVAGGTASAVDLDAFRELQRLAYRAAEEVAGSLEPGVTEREAARRIREHLEGHGVQDWFHTPFAWFGDRSLRTLVTDLGVERPHHSSSLWVDGDVSAHPATPGMGAIEPHGGLRCGVKFEEILVAAEDDAHRMDDDLPHARRWSHRAGERTGGRATAATGTERPAEHG